MRSDEKKTPPEFPIKFDRKLLLLTLNFLMFYIGWGFCLSGVVTGRPFLGPVVVAVLLLSHLIRVRFRLDEMILIMTVAFFGTLCDTAFLNLGLIDYRAGYESLPWLAPLWVTAIWALFAISVNHSMIWLRFNLSFAVLFGMGGGIVSYFAAARLGAAEFYPSLAVVLVIIGLVWAVIMPIIVLWGKWLENTLTR